MRPSSFALTLQDRGQRDTVLAFSGLAPRHHVFEWLTAMQDLPVNVVGVQDTTETWWTAGHEVIERTLRGLLGGLRHQGRDRRVTAIGGSAGGFGAIWLGQRLDVDRVVAFVPQTASGKIKRELGDLRWPDHCAAAEAIDLAVLPASFLRRVDVHVGDDALDLLHASRLPGIHVIRHSGYAHNLPHYLKREGLLDAILRRAITGALV